MNSSLHSYWIRKPLLIAVMAGICLAVACGAGADGNYRDSDGTVTLQLKDGKANMNFGGVQMDGTYKVDGNKITISPTTGDTSQTLVFTINSDGSLDAPQGSPLPKLLKAK